MKIQSLAFQRSEAVEESLQIEAFGLLVEAESGRKRLAFEWWQAELGRKRLALGMWFLVQPQRGWEESCRSEGE